MTDCSGVLVSSWTTLQHFTILKTYSSMWSSKHPSAAFSHPFFAHLLLCNKAEQMPWCIADTASITIWAVLYVWPTHCTDSSQSHHLCSVNTQYYHQHHLHCNGQSPGKPKSSSTMDHFLDSTKQSAARFPHAEILVSEYITKRHACSWYWFLKTVQ